MSLKKKVKFGQIRRCLNSRYGTWLSCFDIYHDKNLTSMIIVEKINYLFKIPNLIIELSNLNLGIQDDIVGITIFSYSSVIMILRMNI